MQARPGRFVPVATCQPVVGQEFLRRVLGVGFRGVTAPRRISPLSIDALYRPAHGASTRFPGRFDDTTATIQTGLPPSHPGPDSGGAGSLPQPRNRETKARPHTVRSTDGPIAGMCPRLSVGRVSNPPSMIPSAARPQPRGTIRNQDSGRTGENLRKKQKNFQMFVARTKTGMDGENPARNSPMPTILERPPPFAWHNPHKPPGTGRFPRIPAEPILPSL
jgi:hypothetical protein